MIVLLHGEPVTLYTTTATGTDAFNRPILSETEITVDDVIIAPLSDEEVLASVELTGRRAAYRLAIPKGDAHEWDDKKVGFWGETFRVIGNPVKGMDDLTPLRWNKKVMVERIE